MGPDCGTFDVPCQVAEATENVLIALVNGLSMLSWEMIKSAFTGNAGTIEANEWQIATMMTSQWALVLLAVVVALMLVQMTIALVQGKPKVAVSAFVGGLLSWPTALVSVWLTIRLTGATDQLSVGILESGDSTGSTVLVSLIEGIEDFPLGLAEGTARAFVLVAAVSLSFIASLMLSIMLAFRNFALIVLVGFSPIAFMAMPMSAIRGWAMKWAQAVVALILAKPIAAGMLVMANELMVGATGVGQWLVGIVAMAMASFAPVITLRLFSFMGAETAAAYGGQGQAVVTNTVSGGARMGRGALALAR